MNRQGQFRGPSPHGTVRCAHQRCSGYVLFTVIVLLVVVAASVLLISYDSSSKASVPAGESETARAEYIAQAALQHAIWQNDNADCAGDLTIAPTGFGPHSYSASIDSADSTTSGTFYADRDAWIKEAAPDDNFGSEVELLVKNKAGDSHRALYHFELSSIAAGSKVVSATAWFYVTVSDDENTIDIHPQTTTWTEAAVTWNSNGTSFDPTVMGSIPSQANSGVWVPIGMTALAQQWVNDAALNHGIMLIASSDDLESKYSSREYSGSLRPYLEVITADGEVSPVQITAIGTLASGVSRTLTRVDATAFGTPAAAVFQPGLAVDDAYTWDGASSGINFGASTALSVNNASAERTTLIRFDLTTLLPPDVRVASAVLGLYLEDGIGLSSGVLDLHRVTIPWVEGIYDAQSPPPGDGVTYDSFDGQTNWTNPGGDFDAALVDTVTIPALTSGWYDWDVTDQFRAWLEGEPNYGLLLRASGGSVDNIEFTSSDSPVVSQHPRLTLTLACECGVICTAPRGSGRVLMVVANPGNLDPGEVLKKSLFETWGYTVSLQNDDDNQASYDSNIAANDVVFVSETVNAGPVGSKLTNASIGVVNEEGELNDELGIATSRTWSVGSTINVTDNTHYITQIFSLGTMSIYTAEMEGVAVAGTGAPSLQILAGFNGAGSPAVLDAGGTTSSGGTAAGRRVLLPVGRNIDLSHVNNNGRLIVQRALQWAAGNTVSVVNDPIFLSTETDATLGGLNFDDIDIAEYDPAADSATLFFEGALTTLSVDIDALHILSNGHIVLSPSGNATLGGLSFAQGDLVDYDPATDAATLIFDGSALFSGPPENIISVHLLDNGHFVLSTDSNAILGGLSFTDEDLVEYDPVTDTATLYFDGSATTLTSEIDAVHVLANGHIVLSTRSAATLGGLNFQDADLVEYDPGTDIAILYFSASEFAANEDVISVHIGAGT